MEQYPWTQDPEEAVRLQVRLREQLILTWDERPVRTIGGVDVNFTGDQARAAIVILRYPDLAPLIAVTATVPLFFPYIPGLLAFREGPAVLAAWRNWFSSRMCCCSMDRASRTRALRSCRPDGAVVENPAIGVAKSRLFGFHGEMGPHAGDRSELRDEYDRSASSVPCCAPGEDQAALHLNRAFDRSRTCRGIRYGELPGLFACRSQPAGHIR